jgi:hypothetical protein
MHTANPQTDTEFDVYRNLADYVSKVLSDTEARPDTRGVKASADATPRMPRLQVLNFALKRR